MKKVYCPLLNCRKELTEVIRITGPEKVAIYNPDRGVFEYSHNGGVTHVDLCPHCNSEISDYVEVDMEPTDTYTHKDDELKKI